MSEVYIRKKDIADMIENAHIISDGEYSGYCTEDIRLDDISTVEVDSGAVGYWLDASDTLGNEYYRCSECGCYIEKVFFGFDYEVRFCPSCGNIMSMKK